MEGPILTSVIARLDQAKSNLASFGIAFSLAMMVEAPIIMIMSASTALANHPINLKKLYRYTLGANLLITAIMLLILTPPIFLFLTEQLMQLPKSISHMTHITTALLLPWPAAIGFRRYYQGVLIRHQSTRRVAYGTVIRLASVICVSLACFVWTDIPGAYLGALSLSTAVTLEAVATRLMADAVLKRIKTIASSTVQEMSYRQIHRFYYPLALTSVITLSVHPIVTFFLSHSRMPIESLAVLPVLQALTFIFRSIGLSYQEVVVAEAGAGVHTISELKSFAIKLAASLSICLGILCFTPLIELWYRHVAGLSEDLISLVVFPTRLLIILPATTVWISYQRGILVTSNMTASITTATMIELSGIITALVLSVGWLDLVGIDAAAFSYLAGRFAACAYLRKPSLEAKSRLSRL